MRALVTGAAGFVGRHVTAALVERGYRVDALDIDPKVAQIKDPFDSRVLPLHMDVRDLWHCDTTAYDLVVHCAAVVGGRRQIEREPLSLAVDLAIDADLFAWALRTRPGAIVYYSSSAAYPVDLQYGPPHLSPGRLLAEFDIDLDDIGTPDLTYGWAKLTGEMLAGHARAAGLRVLTPRPFSGYGVDQALDYPWPSYVERARQRADPFDVWGDGTQVRDWVHIDDVVGATFAALDAGVDGPFNICTGVPTSFDELARLVCEAAGYSPEIRHRLDEPRGVAYRVGDPTLLSTFYEPAIVLPDAIADALPVLGPRCE